MPETLPNAALNRAADSDQSLCKVKMLPPAKAMRLSRCHFYDLHDPLGAWTASLSCHRAPRGRGHEERSATSTLLADGWQLNWNEPREFSEGLAALNRTLSAESLGWRRAAIHLAPDKLAQIVRLPPVKDARVTLAEIPLAARRLDWPLLARAAVVMGMFLNAHPFTDGNGRTARVLVNLLLFDGQAVERFMPLYELALRSEGGFEIALRRAELFQDWAGLIGWLAGCVDICSGATGRSPPS